MFLFQVLPRPVCVALDLHRSDCAHLPLHLHCSSLTIPDISKGKKRTKVITAPLPEYFTRTLHKLGLHHNPH